MRILHLALRADWAAAQQAGRYELSTRGMTLAEVGYVHCSTSDQAPGVLSRYYADLTADELVVLVLDVEALERAGSPVRWDPVPGQPNPFPHVYGPLPTSAVVAELPVPGGSGPPTLPDLSGWDVVGAPPP
jgi:uncharacterized protein (DUF952 family)